MNWQELGWTGGGGCGACQQRSLSGNGTGAPPRPGDAFLPYEGPNAGGLSPMAGGSMAAMPCMLQSATLMQGSNNNQMTGASLHAPAPQSCPPTSMAIPASNFGYQQQGGYAGGGSLPMTPTSQAGGGNSGGGGGGGGGFFIGSGNGTMPMLQTIQGAMVSSPSAGNSMNMPGSDVCGGYSQQQLLQPGPNEGYAQQLLQQPAPTDSGYLQQLLPQPQPVPVAMQSPVRNNQGQGQGGGPPAPPPTMPPPPPPSGAPGGFQQCGQGSYIGCPPQNAPLQNPSGGRPPNMDQRLGSCGAPCGGPSMDSLPCSMQDQHRLNGWGGNTPTSWQQAGKALQLDERNLAQCLDRSQGQVGFDLDPQFGGLQGQGMGPDMGGGSMPCQGGLPSKGGRQSAKGGSGGGGGAGGCGRSGGKNNSRGGPGGLGGGGVPGAPSACTLGGLGGCGGCGGCGGMSGPGGSMGQGAGGGGKGGKGSYKVKLCTYFEQGRCNNGASCTYAHGPAELRSNGGKGGGGMPNTGSDMLPGRGPSGALAPGRLDRPMQQQQQPQQQFDGNLAGLDVYGLPGQDQRPSAGPGPGSFKTRLCTYFQQGHCSRGNQCTFAHGEHELQSAPPRGQGGGPGNLGCGGGGQQDRLLLQGAPLCPLVPPGDGSSNAAGGMDAGGSRGSAYKVKLCTFFEQGKCTKGSTCTFAHGQHELRAPKAGGGQGRNQGPNQGIPFGGPGGGGPAGAGLMEGLAMGGSMMNGCEAQGDAGRFGGQGRGDRSRAQLQGMQMSLGQQGLGQQGLGQQNLSQQSLGQPGLSQQQGLSVQSLGQQQGQLQSFGQQGLNQQSFGQQSWLQTPDSYLGRGSEDFHRTDIGSRPAPQNVFNIQQALPVSDNWARGSFDNSGLCKQQAQLLASHHQMDEDLLDGLDYQRSFLP